MKAKEFTNVELANELAEYGIQGAGGDHDYAPQQYWGAQCAMAAARLMRMAGIMSIGRIGHEMTADDVEAAAERLMDRYEELNGQEVRHD